MYLLMYLFLVFLIPLYESIFLSAKFHSFSAWRTYFNISYSAGVLVMYSCSFCISERVLLLFLKDIFAEYRILGWWFFSFFSFKDIALLSSSVQFTQSYPTLCDPVNQACQWKQCQSLFLGAAKSLQMVIAAMKLKDSYSLEGKLWPT